MVDRLIKLQIRKSESGNTLVSVMVAIGIGAIVILTMAEIMIRVSRARYTFEAETDFIALVESTKNHLRDDSDIDSGNDRACVFSIRHPDVSRLCDDLPIGSRLDIGKFNSVSATFDNILEGPSFDQFKRFGNVTFEFDHCNPNLLNGALVQKATLILRASPRETSDSAGRLVSEVWGGERVQQFEVEFKFRNVFGAPTLESCRLIESTVSLSAFCNRMNGFAWDEINGRCIKKRENCEVKCPNTDIGSLAGVPSEIVDIPDGATDNVDLQAVFQAASRGMKNYGLADLDCDGQVTYLDWYQVYRCSLGQPPHTLTMQDDCRPIQEETPDPPGFSDPIGIRDCDLDDDGDITADDFVFQTNQSAEYRNFPFFGATAVPEPVRLADLLKGDVDCDGRITATDFKHIRYCRNKYSAYFERSAIAATRTLGLEISRTGHETRSRPVANDWPWGQYCTINWNSSCPAGFLLRRYRVERPVFRLDTIPSITLAPVPGFIHIHPQFEPYSCRVTKTAANTSGFKCENRPNPLFDPSLFVEGDDVNAWSLQMEFCCLGILDELELDPLNVNQENEHRDLPDLGGGTLTR